MIQELFQLYADRWQFFLKLTLQHLEISLIAIVAALCIGLSLGILISSYRRSSSLVLGLTNFMYTIPSIALFGFLIPSNLFAVTSLRQLAEISRKVTGDTGFARQCEELADEVEDAVKKYAIKEHPDYGRIYAFETDGFGSCYLMDDANIPSLLALPYLESVAAHDPVYRNTRNFVWSEANPYFFKGKAGEGIGGPHIGYDMVWPMSLIMKAMTSTDDEEIRKCVKMLRNTDGGTGFMHESFHKDNAAKFTRKWFAWANTLFGELIVKLVNEGKVGLLNSL